MENKFESICNELITLQKAKNTDYGDSFSKSVQEFGLTAALIPITNKVNRLKQLVKSDEAQVKDESIDDTLKDLACYAIMTLAERNNSLSNNLAKLTDDFFKDIKRECFISEISQAVRESIEKFNIKF
ncbi:MAG: nucleotide modification associated domain-containing protein [Dysgonomonas sp.]